VRADRLDRYAEVNFCVKGTITAADNLFDDQGKSLLPLEAGKGSRFLSILQLMCFERLIRRTLDRWVETGDATGRGRDEVLKGLLDLMAHIGRLEGSEEGGVSEIPTPDAMVEKVHRVRGGALFALAFVPPRVLEEGETRDRVMAAEPAVARLGTAFQIVDDLTDFEFDLTRRSHNLLVAQVHHHGTPEERTLLRRLLEHPASGGGDGSPGGPGGAHTGVAGSPPGSWRGRSGPPPERSWSGPTRGPGLLPYPGGTGVLVPRAPGRRGGPRHRGTGGGAAHGGDRGGSHPPARDAPSLPTAPAPRPPPVPRAAAPSPALPSSSPCVVSPRPARLPV
jgi:hypothetical protein